LEEIAVNARIEMGLEKRILGHVDCIHLALSGDSRWNVVITLLKPSMP
jgi:hypothetical protein